MLVAFFNFNMLMLIALKVMFFLRAFKEFGKIVELIKQVLADLLIFTVFFIGWVFFFSLLDQNIGMKQDSDDDY